MRIIRRGRMLVILVFVTMLFSACVSTVSDSMTDASGEQYSYSELPAAGSASVEDPPGELSPDEAAKNDLQEGMLSAAEVSDDDLLGEYMSVFSDGALFTVTEGEGFSYQMARRYTLVSDPSFTFDLVFRVNGMLQEAEEGLRLIVDDAAVACTSLTNSTEAEKLLAQNYLYSMYGLELNARMLSGQELSIDEFIGNGTLAQLQSTPFFVALDADTHSFALSSPLLGEWTSENDVFAG